MTAALPIDSVLNTLKEALRTHNGAVLVAPPGAGKTTKTPLALLDEPWLQGRRILMLEPRRLAARTAAGYMAAACGEPIGETVGYRMKRDSRVGPNTRVEVITEGILTRILQNDPSLDGVGLVIFDEFHERSLHADLGLAFCLQSQNVLREDLRILIMSATLEAEPVAELLGKAPVVVSEGRSYPVKTIYFSRPALGSAEQNTAACVRQALNGYAGDILVFLPGAPEIHRVQSLLLSGSLGSDVNIIPLYRNLPRSMQDLAIQPSLPGKRKVILATSIAQTSLTIEGIRVVIDSGLMRVSRFSPRTGMAHLETVRVTRSTANQRRGRAGRLGPGVCLRLWTQQENFYLPKADTPEILSADLAPFALELAAWGTVDPLELSWLDPPPSPALDQARVLLRQLGAMDASGHITPHGKQMAAVGLHPRLSHMILSAKPLDLGGLACELAVLLTERDWGAGEGMKDPDLRLLIEKLRILPATPEARRRFAEIRDLRRQFKIPVEENGDIDACGLVLSLAYPERVAQQRSHGRFLLQNGRGAWLHSSQVLAAEPYLAVAELDDQGAESHIFWAAPLRRDELVAQFGAQIVEQESVAWDHASLAVRARRRQLLGAIVLADTPLNPENAEKVLDALLDGIAAEGLEILPWTRTARQYQARLAFMHEQDAAWPDVSDAALAASLRDWLGPYLYGMNSKADLDRMALLPALENRLTFEQRRQLDEYAPAQITVPSGRRLSIDYSDPQSPVLAVRLQELFGLTETPRIAGGRVALTLHLLSPAQRPVQITKDLASFWRSGYFAVRKDLQGRYPKHYWPDDPLQAAPTSRVRPRS